MLPVLDVGAAMGSTGMYGSSETPAALDVLRHMVYLLFCVSSMSMGGWLWDMCVGYGDVFWQAGPFDEGLGWVRYDNYPNNLR
jgi:hypothetical protein